MSTAAAKPSGLTVTAAATKRWEMNALAGAAAEILIYEEIGFEFTARIFIEQLAALGDVAELRVRINSIGGIASEGIAIYQALRRHPAKKIVYVDAAAYSAASIIAMAASPGELRMAFNARMMIHNAWNIMLGDAADMRKEADVLELLDGTIAATYAKRATKKTQAEMLALMEAETWLDAESAVELGLADQVISGDEDVALPADAAALARRYKHVPQDLLDRIGQRAAGQPTPAAAADGEDSAIAVELMARWAAVRDRQAV